MKSRSEITSYLEARRRQSFWSMPSRGFCPALWAARLRRVTIPSPKGCWIFRTTRARRSSEECVSPACCSAGITERLPVGEDGVPFRRRVAIDRTCLKDWSLRSVSAPGSMKNKWSEDYESLRHDRESAVARVNPGFSAGRYRARPCAHQGIGDQRAPTGV